MIQGQFDKAIFSCKIVKIKTMTETKTKIICYNCNGLGEKTRSRGNHSSIHRTTKCYTCKGDGELKISKDSLKETIIHYLKGLKNNNITKDVDVLWNETKAWCNQNGYTTGVLTEMRKNSINVSIKFNNEILRFTISFVNLQ